VEFVVGRDLGDQPDPKASVAVIVGLVSTIRNAWRNPTSWVSVTETPPSGAMPDADGAGEELRRFGGDHDVGRTDQPETAAAGGEALYRGHHGNA
jgi:hypothetical protein